MKELKIERVINNQGYNRKNNINVALVL